MVPILIEAADVQMIGANREREGNLNHSTDLTITLEQLVLYLCPKNLDRLLKLLMEQKPSSRWWSGWRAALSPLTGSSRGGKAPSEEVERSRLVEVTQIDSILGKYVVKAVYANGRRLESEFHVGYF